MSLPPAGLCAAGAAGPIPERARAPLLLLDVENAWRGPPGDRRAVVASSGEFEPVEALASTASAALWIVQSALVGDVQSRLLWEQGPLVTKQGCCRLNSLVVRLHRPNVVDVLDIGPYRRAHGGPRGPVTGAGSLPGSGALQVEAVFDALQARAWPTCWTGRKRGTAQPLIDSNVRRKSRRQQDA